MTIRHSDMRRFTVHILAICLCLCTSAHLYAAEPLKGPNCIPVKSLAEDKLAYQAGEKLEFNVHYKWKALNSDVAKATVKLDTATIDGIPVFHCSVFGRTARFYDIFFKVREDFQSWFTRDGIVPMRFYRDSREGGYYSTNTYTYIWDPEESRHIHAEIETSRRPMRYEELPLTGCTYDLPSLFYMARNLNFNKIKANTRYPMTFAIDDDVYNVHFVWLGREKKYVKGLGTVNTMKFSANLIAGEVFDGDSDMFVWISEDECRIPVYFEAPIKVGKVSGWLTGWENLKHPFDALTAKKK